MYAIILASESGINLQSFTEHKGLARPLLPVHGKPIIEHIVNRLKLVNGLREISIVAEHSARACFHQWSAAYPCAVPIRVADTVGCAAYRENALEGFARALALVPAAEDVVVCGGDTLFGFSLVDFVERAQGHAPFVSVGAQSGERTYRGKKIDVVSVNADNVITQWHQRHGRLCGTARVPARLYYIPAATRADIIACAAGGRFFSLRECIASFSGRQPVYALECGGSWLEIADAQSYAQAVCLF